MKIFWFRGLEGRENDLKLLTKLCFVFIFMSKVTKYIILSNSLLLSLLKAS